MNVLDAKYFHLWMEFLDTIKSISTHRTILRLHLYVHGAHSRTANYRSVWRTERQHFRGKWTTPSTTSNTSFNRISTIYRLIHESRHYKIWLNPHKCVFCVGSSQLLGFVVSKDEIWLDPCKVQAIIDMPTPSNLLQIQKLQGKANFLRRFIPNYAEHAKGYMLLLKKEVPFN